MSAKDIKTAIREIKREMKAAGVRRISCFNGGLTPQEYAYNSKLFALSVKLSDAEKAAAQ